MLKRALRKAEYAILLIKIGGPKLFLHQLKRQIYGKATFLGLEKDLETNNVHVPCLVDYSLQQATESDMEEMLERSKFEGKGSVHELLQRKWFYESGFRDCYVARIADSEELCYVQWLISSTDDHAMKNGFASRLPRLKEDEILVENAFTFEKYRGKRIMPSVVVKLAEIARNKGFKRMLVYVREDNMASKKGFERAGFRPLEQVFELKLLFSTTRKTGLAIELVPDTLSHSRA